MDLHGIKGSSFSGEPVHHGNGASDAESLGRFASTPARVIREVGVDETKPIDLSSYKITDGSSVASVVATLQYPGGGKEYVKKVLDNY